MSHLCEARFVQPGTFRWKPATTLQIKILDFDYSTCANSTPQARHCQAATARSNEASLPRCDARSDNHELGSQHKEHCNQRAYPDVVGRTSRAQPIAVIRKQAGGERDDGEDEREAGERSERASEFLPVAEALPNLGGGGLLLERGLPGALRKSVCNSVPAGEGQRAPLLEHRLLPRSGRNLDDDTTTTVASHILNRGPQ
jgi:hypothetical protein